MARRCLTSSTAPSPTTAGTGAAPPPPAPHLRWDLRQSAVKVAIAGNVVVVVLLFVAIVWRLFFSTKDQQGAIAPEGAGGNRVANAPDDFSSGTSSPCASPRATGLGKEDLMALPVYVHGAAGEEGSGKVECAVCICELREGETGRILPRCGHRFHAECVDRWFRSQATCPLCRAVVADGGSGEADTKVQPRVSAVR